MLCLFFCSLLCVSQVKVCDLEQQCRSQSEHLHQLSKELLNFRLQSDTVGILKINSTSICQLPLSPDRKLPQVIAGFEAQREKGKSVTAILLIINVVTYLIFTSVFIVYYQLYDNGWRW